MQYMFVTNRFCFHTFSILYNCFMFNLLTYCKEWHVVLPFCCTQAMLKCRHQFSFRRTMQTLQRVVRFILCWTIHGQVRMREDLFYNGQIVWECCQLVPIQ